jgi:hypothetical protein
MGREGVVGNAALRIEIADFQGGQANPTVGKHG